MTKEELVASFQDTLEKCQSGNLARLTKTAAASSRVYEEGFASNRLYKMHQSNVRVVEGSSFTTAWANLPYGRVAVLNFANPHRPGGGIRSRPGPQEEHLCVKTTVLCSLETEEAWPFYQTNLDCGTQAQTDTILFSPNTMVIRNPDLSLREDPFPVAVMTVSAPIASRMEQEELPNLENILRFRIRGMLWAAAVEGYTRLVLGAWGCGNFGNDPELVAKLFHEALQGCFEEVTMAVFDNSEDQYRYSCFEKYFGKPEKE